MTLYSTQNLISHVVAHNDNWESDQKVQIESVPQTPINKLEAGMIVTLEPGAYTAVVSGTNQ